MTVVKEIAYLLKLTGHKKVGSNNVHDYKNHIPTKQGKIKDQLNTSRMATYSLGKGKYIYQQHVHYFQSRITYIL
jgi:hypothetical protein